MGKTDSAGTYSYVCDGTTPGSPVLSDGHALYTPGLSENRGGTSAYYSFDRIGNLWTLDGTTKNQLGYIDFSGFGGVIASAGTGTPFGFGGANGCQTDADTGLVLMGHRYYDTRIGRFISQDHVKDGRNWYSYADNNPVNRTDPSGLSTGLPGTLGARDQRYNGFGGALGSDPGGLFGGQDNLDSFWASENAAMERGHEGYLAYEVIDSAKIWGPNGYDALVRKMLKEIASSPIGLKLLSSVYYEKVLNIMYFHDASSPNSYYQPETDTILYDPALHFQANTSDGLSDEPPIVILEHEMGHDVTGLPDPRGRSTIFDTHGRDNIAVNENPFRQYLGLPDRIDHGGEALPNKQWFDPSW